MHTCIRTSCGKTVLAPNAYCSLKCARTDATEETTKRQSVSDADLVRAYERTGNVWKAGETLGLSGQTVQERLARLGVPRKNKPLATSDLDAIRSLYETGFSRGDGKLDALAERLGRTKALICRKAGEMGLTNGARPMSDEMVEATSERMQEWHTENEHPRGMLGKQHSDETKAHLSETSTAHWESLTVDEQAEHVLKGLKTRAANGTLANPRQKTTWKQGWREVAGRRIYFRSRWEANYARHLQLLKESAVIAEWEHEPETFWFEAIKRGVRSYLPDFRVTFPDGRIEYHEVKGYMDARSKTKLKRMAKYHPDVMLILIQADWFKKNNPIHRALLSDWE